jgi:hypothetical protein
MRCFSPERIPGWSRRSDSSLLGGALERLQGCTAENEQPQLCLGAQRAAVRRREGGLEPWAAGSAAAKDGPLLWPWRGCPGCR